MQFSNPDHPFISFPVSVRLHDICGAGLAISYLLFFTGNIISGNGKNYIIRFRGLSGNIVQQIKYYISRSWKNPEPPFPVTSERKFNPLQAMFYALAMYIGIPILFITGLGLMFPGIVIEKIFGISGLLLADFIHVIAGFLMSLFMFIHIYMCTMGKTPFSSFRAIITGWQQVEKE
jgi:thiosulfate reductase cytochrome b subunit